MSQTRIGNRKKWIRLTLAVVATMLFLPTVAAYAETITYTFSGDGAGTINGNAFSGDFSFVFTSDTSDVAPFGSEYINQTLAGTFTEDSNIYTVDGIFGIIGNPDPAFPRVAFFNPTISSGFGLQDSGLTGYNLATSITASSGGPDGALEDELNGSGFSLDSGADTVIFTSDSTLNFTAAVTPEPSSLILFLTGLCGLALLLRRQVAHSSIL